MESPSSVNMLAGVPFAVTAWEPWNYWFGGIHCPNEADRRTQRIECQEFRCRFYYPDPRYGMVLVCRITRKSLLILRLHLIAWSTSRSVNWMPNNSAYRRRLGLVLCWLWLQAVPQKPIVELGKMNRRTDIVPVGFFVWAIGLTDIDVEFKSWSNLSCQ